MPPKGPEANQETKKLPEIGKVEEAGKKVKPDEAGQAFDNKVKLEAKKDNQKTGVAEKLPQDKIDNIAKYVDTNDALVNKYKIYSMANGITYTDGGAESVATRDQCKKLIEELSQKTALLPKEYGTEYLKTINSTPPNEILALNRALIVLNQLPQATLDKVMPKLDLKPDTNDSLSGDFKSCSVKADTDQGTADMTQDNNVQHIDEINRLKQKKEFMDELRNMLPRIDFILQIPNPKNPKETLYFQKQVNTNGTSNSGRYAITPISYNNAMQHINSVDLGKQEADKPSWIQDVRSNVVGNNGKYGNILKDLNASEDKNKQVRTDAAKQYLTSIAENPDPRFGDFVQKVETALSKGGKKENFKTLMNETFTLGIA